MHANIHILCIHSTPYIHLFVLDGHRYSNTERCCRFNENLWGYHESWVTNKSRVHDDKGLLAILHRFTVCIRHTCLSCLSFASTVPQFPRVDTYLPCQIYHPGITIGWFLSRGNPIWCYTKHQLDYRAQQASPSCETCFLLHCTHNDLFIMYLIMDQMNVVLQDERSTLFSIAGCQSNENYMPFIALLSLQYITLVLGHHLSLTVPMGNNYKIS